MDAAASAIGFFRLPPVHGERPGQQFGRFSLAATSLGLGQTGRRSRVRPGMRGTPVRSGVHRLGDEGECRPDRDR